MLHLIWSNVKKKGDFAQAVEATKTVLGLFENKDKATIFDLLKIQNNEANNTNTVLHLIWEKVEEKETFQEAVEATKFILEKIDKENIFDLLKIQNLYKNTVLYLIWEKVEEKETFEKAVEATKDIFDKIPTKVNKEELTKITIEVYISKKKNDEQEKYKNQGYSTRPDESDLFVEKNILDLIYEKSPTNSTKKDSDENTKENREKYANNLLEINIDSTSISKTTSPINFLDSLKKQLIKKKILLKIAVDKIKSMHTKLK